MDLALHENSMKEKLGFMSLEYVIGDKSYWLTSNDGSDKLRFRVIRLEYLESDKLLPGGIFEEKAYSEITVFNTGWEIAYECDKDLSEIKPLPCAEISWREMSELVDDKTPFWHYQIVKKSDSCEFKINDVDYKVTAYLPDSKIFAIWGSDYSSANPNAITFSDCDENKFNKNFEIKYVRLGEIWHSV